MNALLNPNGKNPGRTPSQKAEQLKAEGNAKFKEKKYAVSACLCWGSVLPIV
jgi:hypothetical protein